MSVIKKRITKDTAPVIIVDYVFDSVPADSTALYPIELVGINRDDLSLISFPPNNLTGETYAADLKSITVSCEETIDFNFRILTINDVSKINSIYQVLAANNCPSYFTNSNIFNIYLLNDDVEETNRVYLFFENLHGGTESGEISVRLIYISKKSKPFSDDK